MGEVWSFRNCMWKCKTFDTLFPFGSKIRSTFVISHYEKHLIVIECKLFKWPWSPWGAEVVLQGADYRGCSYTTRGRALLKGASLAGAARELTFELTYIIHVPFISCYPYFVLCLILVPAAKFPGVFQVQMIKWYLKHICSYLTFANNFIHFSTLILIFPMVKLWELLWLFYHHKECSKFFLFHWSSEIISTFLNPKSYF